MKIFFILIYFYAMADKLQQEQIDKLDKLKEKNLPQNVKESIAEKQKHITKPLNK